jgi:hypothetical protein
MTAVPRCFEALGWRLERPRFSARGLDRMVLI